MTSILHNSKLPYQVNPANIWLPDTDPTLITTVLKKYLS